MLPSHQWPQRFHTFSGSLAERAAQGFGRQATAALAPGAG